MKRIILILLLLCLIYSKKLPLEEIWENVKKDTENDLMINNKYFFIYQEKNYTELDINGEKMISLYSKQNETYLIIVIYVIIYF